MNGVAPQDARLKAVPRSLRQVTSAFMPTLPLSPSWQVW